MEILGIMAIIIGALAYIWKGPRQIMVISSASSAMWVAYFISISQWGPMFVTLTYIFVLLGGAWASDKSVRHLCFGQAVTASIFILISMSGLPMLLAFGGNLLKSFVPMTRNRPYLYRVVFSLAEVLWLSFGLVVGAHSTVAGATIAMSVSVGSGIFFYWRERARSVSSDGADT
ncbi:YgjV family protein [Sulfitobacter sp. R18_1]|nr:YgjV family protein [Sulfitobacter sp. R18_1]